MDQFRIIITGGGTGGHITPGLAIVDSLREKVPNLRVIWVGVEDRREEDIVPRHGISLTTMKLDGFARSLTPKAIFKNLKILFNWLLLLPVIRARRIIVEFQPDVVLGTGGYVCAPMLVAARFMGIKTWILEQNSIPGLTVKILSRFVDVVGIAYENSRRELPAVASVELLGNPVMKSLLSATREEAFQEFNLDPALKTLFVIGGSLGSVVLNDAVLELVNLGGSGQAIKGWQIIHATGQTKFNAVQSKAPIMPNYHAVPYVYRAELAYAAADLILCRGGAMTLAEITARGVPAVIVPWPGAVRNHQHTNALALAENHAAVMISELDLTGVKLAGILHEFHRHPERLKKMAMQSKLLGRPHAAEKIADLLIRGES